jgi:hypothetical protein
VAFVDSDEVNYDPTHMLHILREHTVTGDDVRIICTM